MDNVLLQKHVQLIYDSVLEESGWELLITELVQDMNFRSGTIGVDSQEGGIITRSSYGYEDQEVDLIKEYYHKQDVWTQALWEHRRKVFYPSEQLYPQRALRKTEFYNEFCKPVNIEYTTGCLIESDTTHGLRVAFQRTCDQGSCTGQISHLNALVPHLHQAAKLQQQFRDYETRLHGVSAIIDTLPIAAVLVDENATVHYANAFAEQLFSVHPALQNKQGVLRIRNRTQGAFLDALKTAVRAAAGDVDTCTGDMCRTTMVLSTQQAYSELELQVQPFSTFEATFGMRVRKPLALVYIKEVNPQAPLNREILQDLFRLSARELDLASLLVQGNTLNEIALRKHRSLNTLKTQLKSLFQKTGTHSQSQLVARLLSSLAAAKL